MDSQTVSFRSYLPFTGSPALAKRGDVPDVDPFKLGSKVVLAAAAAWTGVSLLSSLCRSNEPIPESSLELLPETAFAACQVLSYPLLKPAIALLSGGLSLLSEQKAFDEANVEAFLKSDIPPSQLMKAVFRSPNALKRLLEIAAAQPDLLLKKNENGNRILSEFVENNRFKQNVPFVEFGIVGPKAFFSNQIEENNRILKQLLQAAPWPKEELMRCVHSLSCRAPNTLNSLFKEGLIDKDQLTAMQKVKLDLATKIREQIKKGFRDFLGL